MHRFGLNSIGKMVKKPPYLSIHSEYSSHFLASNNTCSRSVALLHKNPELTLIKNQVLLTNAAFYSQNAPDRRPSFMKNVVTNLKEQFTKNTEMQESLKKFQEEAKKLEESEALKDARRKFDSIEGEASKTTNVLKEQLSGITDKVKGTVEEVSKSEAVKKAGEFTSTIGKQAETVTKVAENIGKSEAFKVIDV